MKYAISVLLAILLIGGLAVRADADGTIVSLSADRASPGTEIVIAGTDFGGRGNKVVTIFFSEPSPSYFMYLDIVDWSSTSIRVRIPSLSSNAYRSRSSVILDHSGDTEAFPPDVIAHLRTSEGVEGDLAIRVQQPIGVQNFTNEVDFTVTHVAIHAPGRVVTGTIGPISTEDAEPEITAKHPTYKLVKGRDEPEFVTIPPKLVAKVGDEPKFELKEEPLRAKAMGNIISISPNEAAPDWTIRISGNSFASRGDGELKVYFGPTSAPCSSDPLIMYFHIDSWNDNEIIARVPRFDSSMFLSSSSLGRTAIPEAWKACLRDHGIWGALGIVRGAEEAWGSNLKSFRLKIPSLEETSTGVEPKDLKKRPVRKIERPVHRID